MRSKPSSLTAATLFAALMLLAALAPAVASARPWAAPYALHEYRAPFSSQYAYIPFTRPTVLPNGDSIVVYSEQQSETSSRLVSRRRPAGTTEFEAPKVIDETAGGAPFVGTDGQGRVTVVWVDGDGIVSSRLTTPTGSWTAPAVVADRPAGGSSSIVDFVVAPDGRAALLDHAGDQNSGELARVVTRSAGGTWSTPETLAAGNDFYGMSLDMNDSGAIAVAWSARIGDDRWDVQARVRDAGGTWTPTAGISGAEAVNQFPVAAIDASGRATVAWAQLVPGDTSNIRAASRPAGGDWEESVAVVQPGSGGIASHPQIDAADDGTVVIAYRGYAGGTVGQPGTETSWVGVVERNDGAWGAPHTISRGRDSSQPGELIVAPSGEATVVWRNFDSGTRVLLGHRMADGTWGGPEVVAQFTEPSIPYEPELAWRPDRDAVVAWGTKTTQDHAIAHATWGLPSPPDTVAPDTVLTGGTSGTHPGSDAEFSFEARDENGQAEADATFECRLDRGPRTGQWEPCSSPKQYARLGPAPYTFRVRASDASSNVGDVAGRAFTLEPTGGAPGTTPLSSDGTFGHAGHVLDWGSSHAARVIATPDGKLVVATNSATLIRFNGDGSFDTTFGTNGQALAEFGTDGWQTVGAFDAARAPDGRLYTVTSFWDGTDNHLGIARFTAQGVLDTGFGGDGRIEDTPGWALTPGQILVQSDGRPVAITSTYGQGRDLAFTRYTKAGARDTTFGGSDGTDDGLVIHNPSRWHCFATDAVLQADDKIVVVGNCGNQYDGATDHFVVRYNADGSPDTTFGTDGFAVAQRTYQLEAVALQGDKIVIGGRQTPDGNQDDSAIERLNADGTLDTSFGDDGRTFIAASGSYDAPSDLLVQPDGRIVVLGGMNGQFYLARLDADGAPETNVGSGGLARYDLGAVGPAPTSLARQPDGRLVVGGHALLERNQNVGSDRMFLARFRATQAEDTTVPQTVIGEGPAPGATLTTDTTSFSFHATRTEADATPEDDASFECRLDTPAGAGTWQPCTSPRALEDLDDGQHTFSVRASDAAGNQDATPASRTFTVAVPPPDTTAPALTLLSGPSGTTRSQRAEFGFRSEDGAVFRCSFDNGQRTACASGIVRDGLANGPHTFSVWARDAAGNESAPRTREWTVDTSSPTERHHLEAGGTTGTPPASGGVAVTSPRAGAVTLTEQERGAPGSSAWSFFGPQLEITAPVASAAVPLRLVFRIDSTDVPAGVDETNVVAFRDLQPIALCVRADGTADPAPCTAERQRLADGDLLVVVLSDHASRWNVGTSTATGPASDDDFDPGFTIPPDDTEVHDTDGGDTDGDPGVTGGSSPRIDLGAPRPTKLRKALRKGLKLTGTTSGAARITAVLKIAKKHARRLDLGRKAVVYGRATGQFGAGGFSLRFEPAAKLRRKLKKLRAVPLKLAGEAVDAAGRRTTFAMTFTLRR